MKYNDEDIYKAAFRHLKALDLDPIAIPHDTSGEFAIPVKKPYTTGWTSKTYTEEDFSDPCNIGAKLGGKRHATDIDLDSPEAVTIGNAILSDNEPTKVFGHASKLRSHHIYYTDKSLPSEKLTDPLDSKICIAEYRCVNKDGVSRGMQTVFPPSIWCNPDKALAEDILYDDLSEDKPAFIESAKLHQQFRLIAATSILARYFPISGGRHDTMLALAGVFVKNSLPQEEATRIVTLAYCCSKGYNNDQHEAGAAVKSVYDTFAIKPDSHLFGYPKLIALIDKVVVDRVLELLGIGRPQVEKDSGGSCSGDSGRSVDISALMSTLSSQHIGTLSIPPTEYLIDLLIPKGQLTCLTGLPGNGKSIITMTWCKEIAERPSMHILYLDRDNAVGVARERTDRLGGIPSNIILWGYWMRDGHGNSMPSPDIDSDLLDRLVHEYLKQGDLLLVIDTLRAFADGDENDNAAMEALLRPLKRFCGAGATVILIHHPDKTGEIDCRGASSIIGAIDNGLRLRSTFVTGNSGEIKHMTITGWKVQHGATVNIVYKMVDGVPERQTETVQDKLVSLLSRHQGCSKDQFQAIAKQAGFSRSTVRDFFVAAASSKRIMVERGSLWVPLAIANHLNGRFSQISLTPEKNPTGEINPPRLS